ncbi:MAG: HK97 family phage prohead protease [Bacteroidia bacterium]|nr:HK97 family phage prohead protease [Bacteroidia bacterium]
MSKKNNAEAKADIKVILPVKLKIIESKADDEKGIVEAYVSIFDNVDLVGDIIKRGAFAESLAKKFPKGVWAHNWDQPIAKTLEAREDEKGLYIKGQFNLETQRGKEAYSDLKFGTVDEFSIGFRVLGYEWSEDDPDIRVITKARLYEWSPVLAGANPDTELINVKDDKKKTEKKDEEKEKEEKKEKIIKADYTKIDVKKKELKVYYRENGEKKCWVMPMSRKFLKKHISEIKAHKTKVVADNGEGNSNPDKKILRIRQVAKQNLKSSQYLLRITKSK